LKSEQPSGFSVLARVYWMGLGFVFPFFLAIGIARERGFDLGLSDLKYWIALFAIPVVRLLDIGLLHGETTKGEPATMSDGWKFAGLVLLGGAVVWGLAHGIGAMRG
jgi:hypothetical protein